MSLYDKENKISINSIRIPVEVDWHPELSSLDKRLFGYIYNLSRGEKGCFARNAYLGMFVQAKPDTVSRSISNLRDHGFLLVHHTVNKKTGETERHITINNGYADRYKKFVDEVHDQIIHQRFQRDPYEETGGVFVTLYQKVFENDKKQIERNKIKQKSKEVTDTDPIGVCHTNNQDMRGIQGGSDFEGPKTPSTAAPTNDLAAPKRYNEDYNEDYTSTNVEVMRETRKGTKANTPLREQEHLPNQETLPESTEHLPAPRIIQRIQISSPAQANVPVAEPVEQSPVTKLKANLPATKQTSPVPENNLPADMPAMRGSPSDLKEDSAPPKQNRSIASLAREIALFWISAGLRSFKDEKAKKRAISKLERVLRGTLFNDQPGYEKFYGKKFTVEEVIQAIKNFKIAATDPKYRPGLLATKKKMMQIGLCEWLLNEFCKKNGVATSSFITNLEPPKPVSSPKYEPATEDLYPEITSTLKRVFCQSICQSDNPLVPWDVKDENNFRKTSNFLYDFYEKNKSRVSRVYQGMGPEKMAKLLIQCISSSTDAERFRITTGWLCSSKTLNTRFPQYLVDENIFTNMKPVTENAQFMSRSMRDRIDYKRLGVMVDGNGHY